MATYYISTSGNDTTGSGTYGSPWLTLTKANASSTTGDIIILKNGTYTWSTYTQFTSARTYRGETNGYVFLSNADAKMAQSDAGTTGFVCVIEDIIFKNAQVSDSTVGIFKYVTGSTGSVTFNRCIFRDLVTSASAGGYGIFSSTSTADGYVKYYFNNCLFDDITKDGGTSIFYSNAHQPELTVMYLSLINCVFTFTTGGSTTPTYIMRGNYGSYIYPTIMNTIFYNSTGNSIAFGNNTNPSYDYNCAYTGITSIPSGTGNLTSDPLFIDLANLNFRLRPTSPCRATGISV